MLALYSTLATPSSAIVRGLSLSRSQPNLWIFLSPKSTPSQKTSGLGAVLQQHA